MQLTMKTCSKCKVEKGMAGFYKDKTRPDGLFPHCKSCQSANCKAYQKQNKEKISEQTREYRKKNKEAIALSKKISYEKDREAIINRVRAYEEKNKELVAARKKIYYEQNKEADAARGKAYRASNKKKAAERARKWTQENREKVNARNSRHRAARLNATPAWANASEIVDLYEAAHAFRLYTGQEYHVDHIVPLQGKTVCGLHVPANLQVLLATENASKKNRYWPDMWEKL
jgi:hypothetical protein